MLGKLLHPTTPSEAVRSVAISLAGLVIGTWIVALLTQLNWFANPKHQVSEVTHFFAWLMAQWWFLLLSGLALGFAAGAWLDAYFVRRSGKLWWRSVQAFSIRDAGCLLAGVKLKEFEKSERAISVANELRGYVNSGHVPLFLEMDFERLPPDFSDPKARYEPPFEKKNVGYDAVISKQFIERIAWARNWELPWPIPKPDPEDRYGKPFKRPIPPPPPDEEKSLSALANKLGLLGNLGKKDSDETG
jgi:hypothetical protein